MSARDAARQGPFTTPLINPPFLAHLCSGPGCSPIGIGAFREGVGPFAFAPYDGPAVRNITDTRLIRSPAR